MGDKKNRLRWKKKTRGEKGTPHSSDATPDVAESEERYRKGQPQKSRSMMVVTVLILAGAGSYSAGLLDHLAPHMPWAKPDGATQMAETEKLDLTPERVESLFGNSKESREAAEKALKAYQENDIPRMVSVDRERLLSLGQLGEHGEEELPPSSLLMEIPVTSPEQDEEDEESKENGAPPDLPRSYKSVTYDGFITQAERDQARRLGGFGPGSVRPSTLEVVANINAYAQALTRYDEMDKEEIKARQQDFRSSRQFEDMASELGKRIGQHWDAPVERIIRDGASISIKTDDAGELQRLAVDRSTGRDAYDRAAFNAVKAAAPFTEVMGLPPWLAPVLTEAVFSFGKPPITPEEQRRRMAEGTLRQESLTDSSIDDARKMLIDGGIQDFYSKTRSIVEKNFMTLDHERFTTNRDAILKVRLSRPHGVVMSVNVSESSGSEGFDEMAKSAVDSGSPFRSFRGLTKHAQELNRVFNLHFYPGGIR